MKKKIFNYIIIIIVMMMTIIFNEAVFADGDGWIGPGGDVSEGTHYGGGGDVEKSYSWIHYSSKLGKNDSPVTVNFMPYNAGADGASVEQALEIDAACSKFGGGFWHLGANATSSDVAGNAKYCGLYSFGFIWDVENERSDRLGFPKTTVTWNNGVATCTITRNTFSYQSEESGAWGHVSTRNKNALNSGAYAGYSYFAPAATDLNHIIYKNNTAIYEADDVASSLNDSKIFNEFKDAYKKIYEKEYDKSAIPDNVYAFCSNNSEEEVTLTAKFYTVDGNNPYTYSKYKDDRTNTVTKGTPAAVSKYKDPSGYEFIGWYSAKDINSTLLSTSSKYTERLSSNKTIYGLYLKDNSININVRAIDIYTNDRIQNKDGTYPGDINDKQGIAGAYNSVTRETIDGYKFIGWKMSKSSGRNDIITATTQSNSNPYLTNPASAFFFTTDGTKRRVYRTLHFKPSGNTTVYAYYAPKYTLTKDTKGATVTVNRTSAIYANTTEGLSSGSAIYKSDKLSICTSHADDTTLTTFSVKRNGELLTNSLSDARRWCVDDGKDPLNVTGDVIIKAYVQATLSMVSYSKNGQSLSGLTNLGVKTDTVGYDELAKINHGNNSQFTFLGYKAAGKCVGDGSGVSFLTNTSTTNLNCSPNKTRGYYLSGNHPNSNYDYATYSYARLRNNATVKAIYAPKQYTLTVKADAHSTVTVTRTRSPYQSAGKLEPATVKNGTKTYDIYYGDELSVVHSADGCSNSHQYNLDKKILNGYDNGMVTGDVYAEASSVDASYKLTIKHMLTDFVTKAKSDWDDEAYYSCTGGNSITGKAHKSTLSSSLGLKFVAWGFKNGTSNTYYGASYAGNPSSTSYKGPYLTGNRTDSTNPNGIGYQYFNIQNIDKNYEVYAVYTNRYTLTATADAHSTIKVFRTNTNGSRAPINENNEQLKVEHGGTNTLAIYKGDRLWISFGSDNCFSLTTQKIETTSKKPEDHVVDPVSSDVTVSSESATTQYKLTVNRAAGSGIKVNRTSSPNKGASRGDLYNKTDASDDLNKKFDIYCGDTLKTNFSLFEGYSWGSHSLVGKDTNNTTDLSPPEHTVGADVIVQTTDMVRNAFLGRARVTTGDTFNNVDSISTTDWLNTNKTITRKINCPNAGCSAVFDLALKREEGSGKTPYVAKRNNEDLTLKIDSTQRAPYMPSTNGSTLIIDKKTEYQESLKPGQEVCYSIEFKPYGKLSNDKTVPLKACAQGKVATFEGMSEAGASEADSKSTGWQNKTPDKETRYILENCDPIAGCKATIKHSLKKTEGSGSTDYTITRRSNYYDAKTGHGYESRDSEDPLASGTFSPNNNNSQTIRSEELTLYPGQVVCETLSFLPSNNQVNAPNLAEITVCVSAIGNAQSPDPTPGTPDDGTPPGTPDPNDPQEESTISNALISIKVKNTNVTKYSTYQYTVYAKPNDILLYRSSYNPKLQYTTKLIPEKMRIDGGATIYSNSGLSLQYLFNEKTRNVINPWNNDITVNIGNESKDYDYTVGDTSRQVEVSDERKVNTADVGKKIDGIARTNQKASTKTTPSQVTFTDDGTGNVANVITSPISSTATAIVPYNFKSKVEITTDEDTPIHSGEEDTLLFDVDVLPKPNSETTNNPNEEAYATIVRNPKTKLVQYTIDGEPKDEGTYGSDDLCGYFSGNSGCEIAYEKTLEDLNKNSNKAGSKHSFTAKFSVPDVKAGTKICFAVAFYPSDSGSDTNLSASGSGLWAVSKSKCYTVAKKPSFQAWGGSMYIAGKADVPVSAKKNLSGYDSDGNYHVFGSWVEIGLTVGSGNSNSLTTSGVSGLASGAGTGYSGLGFARNPGGSTEKDLDFCKRSTLSIANDKCKESGLIGPIGSSDSSATANNKKTLIDKVLAGKNINRSRKPTNGIVDLTSNDSDSGTESNEEGESGATNSHFIYYNSDLGFELKEADHLEAGTTYLVQSSGTITITGNLSYGDATYSKLSEVPKLIIYADNIIINCNVNRIDAVLIANNNVDTCPTGKDEINRPENSNRLQVNGMIISNTLNLNRTYGASTGNYSIIPAEIVNLDTTLYLWSNGDDNVGGSTGKFSESYIHELAPRY